MLTLGRSLQLNEQLFSKLKSHESVRRMDFSVAEYKKFIGMVSDSVNIATTL